MCGFSCFFYRCGNRLNAGAAIFANSAALTDYLGDALFDKTQIRMLEGSLSDNRCCTRELGACKVDFLTKRLADVICGCVSLKNASNLG